MIPNPLSKPIQNESENMLKAYQSSKPNIFIGTPCPYCGDTLTKENFSKDHVIPLSDNLYLKDAVHIMYVCSSCNNKKDSRNFLSFIGLLPKLKNNANPHEPGIKTDEKSKKLSNICGLTVKTVIHGKGKPPAFVFFNEAGQSIKQMYTYPKAVLYAEGIAFGLKLKGNA